MRRNRRIDRQTAEEMLCGAGVRAEPDALAGLLAAAAAPARDGELAGQDAAMAAFRSARIGPAPQHRRGSMIKTTLAKLLTAKAAAVVAATAASGIAVAAGTGHLPAVSGGEHPTTSPSAPATGAPTSHPTGAADEATSDKGSSATPSPSLVGLCHAYTAGVSSSSGKALDNPAFTALITAAGGKDKVQGYCVTLLKSEKGKPSDSATRDAESHPTGAPETHSTSAPDAHPTGAPESHQSGQPTQEPTARPTEHNS